MFDGSNVVPSALPITVVSRALIAVGGSLDVCFVMLIQ